MAQYEAVNILASLFQIADLELDRSADPSHPTDDNGE